MAVWMLNLPYMYSYASEPKVIETTTKAIMVTPAAKNTIRKVKRKIDKLGLSPWTWTAMTLSYHYSQTNELTTKIVPEWNIKADRSYIRPDVTYQPRIGEFGFVMSTIWSF